MHVFVTGGTGFFGKALLRHWAAAAPPGLAVTLLSRSPASFLARHRNLLDGLDVRLVEGDVLRPESLPATGDFTHVLHAATDSTLGLALSPRVRYDQIVDGTRHVLDFAVRLGIPRFLLTSSGGAYGPQPASIDAIPEDYLGMADPLDPQNAYSVGKRAVEHLCALYASEHGLETVVARCFAFVGEDLPRDAHFAIGNFIGDALAGRPIVIQGDGSPVRSWLDQRDLARWLVTLLERGQSQRAYNVGADAAWSLADAAAVVQSCAGKGQEVRILGARAQGQSANRSRYIPDVARVRTELGLVADFDLNDSVNHVLQRARAIARSS